MRRTTAGRRQGLPLHQRRSTGPDPHLTRGEGTPNLHLNLILQSEGVTNEANSDPQAGMTAGMTDVTSNGEVVPIPGHRKGPHLEEDQHLTPEGLKDPVQKTGDNPVGGEGLYLIP